ncbi:hypothetical protein FOZ63_031164 [Perkinsus olseni]|uniref:Uncharacterized protein n=2 Tax=Perkinsus olseni TaxID=32597 RepID=A0A7J6TFD3_PEROL|nr:hypothetical protein FOZ63_031164 [Perkinsus olseni]
MSVALIGVALAILEGDSKFKEINAYTVQGDAARSQYSPEDDSDLSSTVNEVTERADKRIQATSVSRNGPSRCHHRGTRSPSLQVVSYKVIAFALKHRLHMKPFFVMSIALSIGVALAILEGDSEAKEINLYIEQDDAARSQYSLEVVPDLSSPVNVVGQFLMTSVEEGSPGQVGVHGSGKLPTLCNHCKFCVNSVVGMAAWVCWNYAGQCGVKADNGLKCICCSSE